jgi:peptidoglycan hydrolase-like protein with peptidoglycan-binding domain
MEVLAYKKGDTKTMKKAVVLSVLVTLVSVGFAHAEESSFLETTRTVRQNLSASAFSAAAQRANPAANVIYPKTVATPAVANATAATAITKTLSRGLKNDAQVKILQEFLITKGFLVATADGNFGPKTETAVKKFQRANGVSPLGIVGPQTRALIK